MIRMAMYLREHRGIGMGGVLVPRTAAQEIYLAALDQQASTAFATSQRAQAIHNSLMMPESVRTISGTVGKGIFPAR